MVFTKPIRWVALLTATVGSGGCSRSVAPPLIEPPPDANPPLAFHLGLVGAPISLFGSPENPTFEAAFDELKANGFDNFFPYFGTSESSAGTPITEHFDYFLPPAVPGATSGRHCNGPHNPYDVAKGRLQILFPAFMFAADPKEPFDADTFKARYRDFKASCLKGDESVLLALESYDEPANNYVQSWWESAPAPSPYRLENLRALTEAAHEVSRVPVVVVDAPLPLLMEVVPELHALDEAIRKNAVEVYWQAFPAGAEAGDWFGFDVYPVPLTDPGVVGDWIQEGKRRAPEKPVIAALQGFGFHDMDGRDGRRPTAEETRFMAFDAVIHGAQTIVWWGPSMMVIEQDGALWEALKATARELRSLEGIITAPTLSVSFVGEGVEVTGRRQKGSAYILVANRSKASRLELNVPPAETQEARHYVVRDLEDETVIAEGATEDAAHIVLSLPALAVRLLRVDYLP